MYLSQNSVPGLTQIAQSLELSIRTDLQNLREEYFCWFLISTVIVVVGLVMEGPEVFDGASRILKRRPALPTEKPSLTSAYPQSEPQHNTPRWIAFLAL